MADVKDYLFRVLNPHPYQVIMEENYEKADSSTVFLASGSRVRYRCTCTARGVPGKELGAPLSRRATVPGWCAQGARHRHQEKGEREQRVARCALGPVLRKCRRDEDILCL